ncbi:MAG: preprotein translocase subunit SecE [Chloroflexi bacterium]|nr:preprotein translocase subunit SecE [Chloroflexota bacterium]MCY3583708.1 preprotein translocase subunit SecE [Chloroflexota bacterium]MCY3717314.1 preprotein translocase subunit SecE [Chloroflexota bacterium]MDE2649774.1 preprotein translocase subunit SecE [Chloroflexota bacterium]
MAVESAANEQANNATTAKKGRATPGRRSRRSKSVVVASNGGAPDENQQSSAITEKKGKATPGRRTRKVKTAKAEPQGNFITRPLYMTVDYFSDVRSEMNKVAWPSREDTRRLTILCINVTIVSAIFLGILAVIWSEFMRIGLQPNMAWMLIAVIAAMLGGAFYMIRRGTI